MARFIDQHSGLEKLKKDGLLRYARNDEFPRPRAGRADYDGVLAARRGECADHDGVLVLSLRGAKRRSNPSDVETTRSLYDGQ